MSANLLHPLTAEQIRRIVRDEVRCVLEEEAEALSSAPRDRWLVADRIHASSLTPSFLKRFWAKIDKNGPIPEARPDLGPCWLWLAAKDEDGYGRIRLHGSVRQAHRIAFLIGNGELDPEKTVDHLCLVKSCENWDHMEQVPILTNVRRASNAPSSINRMKDECENGHAFDDSNTLHFIQNGRPVRKCRRCAQDRYEQHKAERKALPALPKPDRETLAREIVASPFMELALRYHVSDNTIRNWARSYGLEVPKGHPAGRRKGV
jgi:hypothetical protein